MADTHAPIKIDLADLTEEWLEEAIKAGRRMCQYSAPCIIGTLMSVEQRKLADKGDEESETLISSLIASGIVQIPKEQALYAERLQWRFDEAGNVSDKALRRYARSVMKRFARPKDTAA